MSSQHFLPVCFCYFLLAGLVKKIQSIQRKIKCEYCFDVKCMQGMQVSFERPLVVSSFPPLHGPHFFSGAPWRATRDINEALYVFLKADRDPVAPLRPWPCASHHCVRHLLIHLPRLSCMPLPTPPICNTRWQTKTNTTPHTPPPRPPLHPPPCHTHPHSRAETYGMV